MRLSFPRLQFSLRTLVIGMVIVAALASWHGSRYMRFQARVAAKNELANAGINLRTEPLGSDPIAQLPSSWAEHWDEYWFGHEAIQKYIAADTIGDFTRFFAAATFEQNSNQFLQFPELESLDIGTKVLEQHPTGMAEGYMPEAIPEKVLRSFAKLPRLRKLELLANGIVDDIWVAALSENSPLEKLHIKDLRLTPAGTLELLRKAPRLRQLLLNQEAIDERVVAALSRGFDWGTGIIDGPDAAYLIVTMRDPRQVPEYKPEAAVKELRIPYCLEWQAAYKKPVLNADQFVIENYFATSLKCNNVESLTLRGFPQLKQVTFRFAKRIRIEECPQFQELQQAYSSGLRLEKLPALSEVNVRGNDQVEIRDCQRLKSLLSDGTSTATQQSILTLAQLPSLESLSYSGHIQVSLDGLPKLASLELRDPTAEQLKVASTLPTLKNLTLDNNGYGRGPNVGVFDPQQFPNLERLKLDNDFARGTAEEQQQLLRKLQHLKHLKLLWISQVNDSLCLIAPYQDGGITYLPKSLEVLITDMPIGNQLHWAILCREHPELKYANLESINSNVTTLRHVDLQEIPLGPEFEIYLTGPSPVLSEDDATSQNSDQNLP